MTDLEELRKNAGKVGVLSVVCTHCEDGEHTKCFGIFPINDGIVALHFCACECEKAVAAQTEVQKALDSGELRPIRDDRDR